MNTRGGRLSRREMLGAAVLGLLIVVVELVLVMSYVRGAETNDRFGASSTLVTTLANVQREVLRLHVDINRLVTDPEVDLGTVDRQRAILASVVRNLESAARRQPEVQPGVAAIAAEVAAISDRLRDRVDSAASGRAVAAEFGNRLVELERSVKNLYDREEIAYFASTSDALETQESSQFVMVIVAVAIGGVGVGLALLLRRRVKDEFAKAYFRLEAEMTERERAERALRHQATHDALTGAPNRALFLERLEEAVLGEHSTGVAVLFIDVDDFKTINDSLGHAAGDLLLRSVADRIRACLRQDDVAARLGGDEFAVLLARTTSPGAAQDVARRIIEAIRRPFMLKGDTVLVSATIGIAETGGVPTGVSADELLRNADLAMYAAKAGGKNRADTFRPEMHEDAINRLTVRTELERAIAQRELIVHYQPLVELADSSIVGVEALVRWQHPARGLVSPADFIPVAEESGLIVPIGRAVLIEACRTVAGWIRDGIVPADFGVSVNVSPRQLQDESLIRDVESALARSGLPATCLTLEMTESLLVNDVDAAATTLESLKELGIQLAIDDFGTGYSSLSYLSRFPIDVLKVDRSFVAQASSVGGDSVRLARTIIGLGEALGLPTIAEGIEHAAQVGLVRELGCRYGQGYFFARPADAAATASLLRASRDPAASNELGRIEHPAGGDLMRRLGAAI
jgi:diguanylate cyclase (GGDEF)-like protein